MPVSIIIPAYNARKTIGRALSSLQEQTLPEWEAIVIDDGSTDHTGNIVKQFAKYDRRIFLIKQPNSGASVARHRGLIESQYDWLVFLDADDWLLPKFLQRMLAETVAHPDLDAVHCGWVHVDENGRYLKERRYSGSGHLFDVFTMTCAFAVHACLVSKRVVVEAGGFDPSFRICQNWDMWQRVARTGARFGALAETLVVYRTNPGSLSTNGAGIVEEGLRIIEQGHAPDSRVKNPHPAYANGRPEALLEEAKTRWLNWLKASD